MTQTDADDPQSGDDTTVPLDSSQREALASLPPSAKLVAKVLDRDDNLDQQALVERTLLPERTVRYALSRLDEHDLIESRFAITDARKRLYSLTIDFN